MQNAECKMQNSTRSFILHLAFCILHFDYRSPREMTIFSNVSRTPGSVEWHLRFPRMQNARFGAQSHFAFCILHFAFRLPLPSRNHDLLQRLRPRGQSNGTFASRECKMQDSARSFILYLAFRILHFDYRSPREITISSNVSRYSSGVSRIAAPVGQ